MGTHFWIGNPSCAKVLVPAWSNLALAAMQNDITQIWTFGDNGNMMSMNGLNWVLTAPISAGLQPVLVAVEPNNSNAPAQNWSFGDDGRLVSGTHIALSISDTGGQLLVITVADSTPVDPATKWQLIPAPEIPPKSSYNEFQDLLPTDSFRIVSASSNKVLATTTPTTGVFNVDMVDIADDPDQIWTFEPTNQQLINGSGLVLTSGYSPESVCGAKIDNPQLYQSTAAWIFTGGYLWIAASVEGSNGEMSDQVLTTEPTPGFATPNSFDKNQLWSIELVEQAQDSDSPALIRTALDSQATSTLTVKVTTSNDFLAGTDSDVSVSVMVKARSIASKNFVGGVSRGSVVSFSAAVNNTDVAEITNIELYAELRSSLLWPWPVEDEWKIASIEIILNSNAHLLLPNINGSAGQDGLNILVPPASWKSLADDMPVDRAQCRFSVKWPQWLIDCAPYVGRTAEFPYIYLRELNNFPWGRSYDQTKIAGIGLLIGIVRGMIVGELLNNNTCEILKPGKYTYAYSREQDAIIYKFYSADGSTPANYIRHSQLVSGQEVIMAGEFVIANGPFGNEIASVIAEVNNASGHYQPDNAACLYWVQKKLNDIGIPVQSITWWVPH